MRNHLGRALAAAGATTILATALALGYSSGPPADCVGLCEARRSCKDIGCHDDFPLNSGTAISTLALEGSALPATYRTNEMLRFLLDVTDVDSSRLRFGFELGAVSFCPSARQAGILTLAEPNRTLLTIANGVTFAEHTCFALNDPARCGYLPATPGTNSWKINWQAPPTYVGPVTVYWAINAADGGGDPHGDSISLNFVTLDPHCPDRVADLRARKAACDPIRPGVSLVELTWASIPWASGYRIYRADDPKALPDPVLWGAGIVTACDDPPPAPVQYYTVVGLCRDASDGPL